MGWGKKTMCLELASQRHSSGAPGSYGRGRAPSPMNAREPQKKPAPDNGGSRLSFVVWQRFLPAFGLGYSHQFSPGPGSRFLGAVALWAGALGGPASGDGIFGSRGIGVHDGRSAMRHPRGWWIPRRKRPRKSACWKARTWDAENPLMVQSICPLSQPAYCVYGRASNG